MPIIETKHRRIVAPIPVEGSLAVLAEMKKYEPRAVVTQAPIVWDRAEGYQVYDPHGNCWIAFSSGILVANTGHAHPHVCEALSRCIDEKLLHMAHPKKSAT